MIKLKGRIPGKYTSGFINMQTARFKSTLQLFSLLLAGLFTVGTLSINLIVLNRFPIQFWPTWFFVSGVCIAAIIVSRKSSSPAVLKLTSMLLLVSSLLVVARNHLNGNAPVLVVLGFYVFMLFCFSFPFPWMPIEGLLVAAVVLLVYALYYVNMFPFVSPRQESLDFYQGVIVLLMAATVVFFVKRNVMVWLMDTYILQRQIEEKNGQIQKDLVLATRVHKRLIPGSVATKLADIGVSYVPMLCMGGDYARYRFVDRKKLLFIIADVTGHGVPAALLVNALNAEFEILSEEGKSPGDLLKELDAFIKKDFAETGMYLTAFCGLLDYHRGKFIYSSYGHPPQYIYHSKEHDIVKMYAQASFLGLPFPDDNVYENEIGFNRGDRIVLFTDGVTEARNEKKEEFGAGHLERFITENYRLPVVEFNKELLDRLSAFTGNKYDDDVFILNILTK